MVASGSSRSTWRALAIAVVAYAMAVPAAAAPTCATGFYEAMADLLPGGGKRVSMRDGAIHIAPCTPVKVTLRSRRKRVLVKAGWSATQCPAVGNVRLVARLDAACTKMTGVVKAKRRRKKFVASAVSAVPPPTVTVDATVVPTIAQVPGFDGEPPRPVAALTDH